MTKTITLIVLALIISTSIFGQTDKKYAKTLKEMFKASGTEESYQIVISQMFAMFKQNYSEVESELWDGMEKEFLKTSLNELAEMLVPVYSKYLTKEDLEELIKFYRTPIGKKFAKNTPLIMKESMLIGQEWGEKVGQDFMKKMEEKGY